jgi:acyl-CoA synthetase (AMP-forming)/AMP-acid ligase II
VFTGAHVVIPSAISPFTYRDLLDEYRPRLASMVPTVLDMLVATGRGWQPPSTLEYVVTAAAPLSARSVRAAHDRLGLRVLQGYGLTETVNFSTTMPTDLGDAEYRTLVLEADVPPIGVALPGNEVAVLDESGSAVGHGEVGEICMRGHNVMTGYVDRPDLTAEAFAGGWFHSGDLGCSLEGPDGRTYFRITGRRKNIALVGGVTISLEEIEATLLRITGVVDAGCVARPDPVRGESVLAFVRLDGTDVAQVRVELGRLVPAFMVPGEWRSVDLVPRTATGKLQRRQLLEQARQVS